MYNNLKNNLCVTTRVPQSKVSTSKQKDSTSKQGHTTLLGETLEVK